MKTRHVHMMVVYRKVSTSIKNTKEGAFLIFYLIITNCDGIGW